MSVAAMRGPQRIWIGNKDRQSQASALEKGFVVEREDGRYVVMRKDAGGPAMPGQGA